VETSPYEQFEEPEQLSLRERFMQSRVGRGIIGALAVTGLLTTASAIEPAEAHADEAIVYHATGTEGMGLWLHPDAPTLDSAKSETIPEGGGFKVECWKTGSSVFGDNVWERGINLSTGNRGYASDFYLDTNTTKGSEAEQLRNQGMSECDAPTAADIPSTSPKNPWESGGTEPFAEYDRNAAKNWALSHAQDTPPDAGSCTWFVSQTLEAGSFPQDDTWSMDYGHIFTRDGPRRGTSTAWLTQKMFDYLKDSPYVEYEPIGDLGPAHNNQPDAKPGDIIFYDWDNKDGIDHAAVVVGDSPDNPEYPIVSAWSEDGDRASKYQSRGWTWSEKHHEWIQQEPEAKNVHAYLMHIRTQEDVIN
jgi:hypothetical protein